MRTTKALIAIAFMAVFLLPVMVSSTTAEPARADIVWFTGYDTTAANMNPFISNPFFGHPYMYEPLFGLNTVKNNTLIPVIGVSYDWNTAGTEVTVVLNDKAKFNDGTAVTADDVVFSYQCANASSLWATMKDRIDNIEAVDTTHVKFTLKAAYAKTGLMVNYLTRDVPIVPKAVWKDVNFTKNAPADMDGFASGSKMTVGSGPYKPYMLTADKKVEIYVRTDSWWGAGVIHQDLPNNKGMPVPKYIGSKQISDNTAKDASFLAGEIDVHAGFYKNVVTSFYINDRIETFYGHSTSKFYLPLGSVIYVAPNTERFPFNDKTVRAAMGWVLDYDAINTAASGNYWSRAKQGILDNNSAAQKDYYDDSIQTTYGISYNFSKGIEVLKTNFYDTNTSTQKPGQWIYLTKNYTGDLNVMTCGGVTVGSLGDWDTVTPGLNVPILGFEIMVPAGWSDVVLASQMWAGSFSRLFNMSVVAKEMDTGIMLPNIDQSKFDVIMQCCGPKMLENPLTLFGSYIGDITKPDQNAYWGSINVTRWSDAKAAEFKAIYQTLETNMTDQTVYKDKCKQLQTILAQENPAIPVFNNGFWYTVNTQYWQGWCQESNYFQPPATAWTNDILAVKQRLVLNLVTGKGAAGTSSGIAWSGLEIASLVGVIAVMAAIIMKRKHD